MRICKHWTRNDKSVSADSSIHNEAKEVSEISMFMSTANNQVMSTRNMSEDSLPVPSSQVLLQPAPAMPHPPTGTTHPSLQYPTREFLDTNLRKPDLQKRCREMGLTNIWTTKSQLITMLLEKCQPTPNTSDAPRPAPPSPDASRRAPSEPQTPLPPSQAAPARPGDLQLAPSPHGDMQPAPPPDDIQPAPSPHADLWLTPLQPDDMWLDPTPPADLRLTLLTSGDSICHTP
ncbi:hypothetical protein GWK47_004481 [Chionoecetes opilio]|uniref:Uncharacterized protein n=1 Tax=Chionoecetes opilio TaxID=41210 RepID=A0A8J4YLR0_CHIOP|nr:hypothetical protein GWK47_004481 [Chionoecetes opilio]